MPSSETNRPCGASPFCRPLGAVVRELGLSPRIAWRWVHLTSIDDDTVTIVEHPHDGRAKPHRYIETTAKLAGFAGFHLDLIGVSSPPPDVAASYHAVTGLWYVYGAAWGTQRGPRVTWRADADGPGTLRTHAPGVELSYAAQHDLDKATDLLRGRLTRRGRPRHDEAERRELAALAERAEAIKSASPRRSYQSIALSLGVPLRSLERYRHDLADGRLSPDAPVRPAHERERSSIERRIS